MPLHAQKLVKMNSPEAKTYSNGTSDHRGTFWLTDAAPADLFTYMVITSGPACSPGPGNIPGPDNIVFAGRNL